MNPIQLGIDTHHIGQDCNGKAVCYKYTLQNLKDEKIVAPDGWVDSDDALPHQFDLHELEVEGREINLRGWWTGSCWDGLRITRDMKIKRWKS